MDTHLCITHLASPGEVLEKEENRAGGNRMSGEGDREGDRRVLFFQINHQPPRSWLGFVTGPTLLLPSLLL